MQENIEVEQVAEGKPVQCNPLEEFLNRNNQVTCAICFNDFDLIKRIPMMLCSEQHNICRRCLKDMKKTLSRRRRKCPLCKEPLQNTFIKKNRLLSKIMQEYQQESCSIAEESSEWISKESQGPSRHYYSLNGDWLRPQTVSLRPGYMNSRNPGTNPNERRSYIYFGPGNRFRAQRVPLPAILNDPFNQPPPRLEQMAPQVNSREPQLMTAANLLDQIRDNRHENRLALMSSTSSQVFGRQNNPNRHGSHQQRPSIALNPLVPDPPVINSYNVTAVQSNNEHQNSRSTLLNSIRRPGPIPVLNNRSQLIAREIPRMTAPVTRPGFVRSDSDSSDGQSEQILPPRPTFGIMPSRGRISRMTAPLTIGMQSQQSSQSSLAQDLEESDDTLAHRARFLSYEDSETQPLSSNQVSGEQFSLDEFPTPWAELRPPRRRDQARREQTRSRNETNERSRNNRRARGRPNNASVRGNTRNSGNNPSSSRNIPNVTQTPRNLRSRRSNTNVQGPEIRAANQMQTRSGKSYGGNNSSKAKNNNGSR